MVARLDAGALTRFYVVILAILGLALGAHASIEDGQKQMAAYRQVLTEMDGALAQQDASNYEALGKKSVVLLEEARQAFEAGKAGESSDPAVVFAYVEAIKLAGDDDLGAEIAGNALQRGVESAALWRIYGEMCLATGPSHYKRGVEALQKSAELDGTSPESADTWFDLGRYYLDRGLPDPAAKAFASALAANSAHVPALLGNAAAKIYGGDIAAAGEIIEQVGRAAQPYDVMMRTMVRAALFDFEVARRDFTDTAENHYAYARLMYIAARFPEAIQAAKRAGHLAPDRIDILNFEGAIQIQAGDYAGALAAYEASLRAKADQPQVQQTVEQLRQAQQEAAKQQASPAPTQGQGPLR